MSFAQMGDGLTFLDTIRYVDKMSLRLVFKLKE